MNLRRSLIVVFSLAILVMAMPLVGRASNESPFLKDARDSDKRIDNTTRQLIVCIHGWNPDGVPNAFYPNDPQNGWTYLENQLMPALVGTDWKLSLYHWEGEANTGFIDFPNLAQHAEEAAANALTMGHQLADIINRDAPDLRQLHLIAHSAGAWAAWAATNDLLESNPYLTIQVTLLDPFIPSTVNPYYSPTWWQMTSLAQSAHADRIYRLENHWSADPQTLGTDNDFDWRLRDITQKVDHIFVNGGETAYLMHCGPIDFYADTVSSASNGYTPGRLYAWSPPYTFTQVGWYRSLAHESFLRPRITKQPEPLTTVPSGTPVTLSVEAANGSRPLYYEWRRVGGAPLSPPVTTSSYTFNAQTNAEYVVRVYDNNNIDFYSDNATIEVTAGPCTSFSISPTSASPGSAAGSQTVAITGTPAGCTGGSWTASGNGSWITVSPTSGSGSGTATVYWAQNASASPRSGSASIIGNGFADSFLVNQGGPRRRPAPVSRLTRPR
jgi:hypothetical protein